MCYQVLFSGFLLVVNELNVLFFSLAAWFLGGTDSLTCNLECCSDASSGYLHVIVIFENTHPEVLFSGFLAVLYEFNVLFPYFVAYRGTVSLTCCPECCSDASFVYFHILVIPWEHSFLRVYFQYFTSWSFFSFVLWFLGANDRLECCFSTSFGYDPLGISFPSVCFQYLTSS